MYHVLCISCSLFSLFPVSPFPLIGFCLLPPLPAPLHQVHTHTYMSPSRILVFPTNGRNRSRGITMLFCSVNEYDRSTRRMHFYATSHSDIWLIWIAWSSASAFEGRMEADCIHEHLASNPWMFRNGQFLKFHLFSKL